MLPPRLRWPSRATLLALLLGATLVTAVLVAVEAVRAARSGRVTAERALRDYATFAAGSAGAAAADLLRRSLADALAPATGTRAASPYDRLPPPQVIDRSALSWLGCARAPADSALAFRLDLRDGSLLLSGHSLAPEAEAALRARITDHAQRLYRPEWRAGLVPDPTSAGDFLGYSVKYAQVGAYLQPGAPVAAYGVRLCAGAPAASFRRVFQEAQLVPSAEARGRSNRDLVSLSVRTQGGRPIFGAESGEASGVTGESRVALPDTLVVRVALRPELAALLTAGGSAGDRLPFLVALLGLTGGLSVIAVLLLRREHELVRLRQEFTSSVSHELRTPLAQILLFGETLSLGRARSEQERAEAAGTIVEEAHRLMHLVDNVLHFSRVERGTGPITPGPVQLGAELEAVAQRFEPLARAAGCRLAVAVAGDLTVSADRGALRQMVLNLLDNAAKYGPPGQTIRLALERDGPHARIVVEDEGPGVPPESRERVWLPYVRGRNGNDRPGTGIGLAVVRALAEAHGGTATVEPLSGGGARFVITLPATAPALSQS